MILQDGEHVIVPGHDPKVERRGVEDGLLPSRELEDRERVVTLFRHSWGRTGSSRIAHDVAAPGCLGGPGRARRSPPERRARWPNGDRLARSARRRFGETAVVAGARASRVLEGVLDRHTVVVGAVYEKLRRTQWESRAGSATRYASGTSAGRLRAALARRRRRARLRGRAEVADATKRNARVHRALGSEPEREVAARRVADGDARSEGSSDRRASRTSSSMARQPPGPSRRYSTFALGQPASASAIARAAVFRRVKPERQKPP